ncbi:MAG: hypothetical protein LBP51_06050 [Deferribacteraceae bacterium]|jgi:hypothetical protein|nr:hypothetical protein [Deferribacteraceae bacterium]
MTRFIAVFVFSALACATAVLYDFTIPIPSLSALYLVCGVSCITVINVSCCISCNGIHPGDLRNIQNNLKTVRSNCVFNFCAVTLFFILASIIGDLIILSLLLIVFAGAFAIVNLFKLVELRDKVYRLQEKAKSKKKEIA